MPRSSQSHGSPIDEKPRRLAIAAAMIVVATFAAYLPAVRGGFIWDDDAHVTIPELRTAHGLYRIWLDVGATQQYYPLLHTTFWLQHKLWGDSPVGYHLVNIALHACAALLVMLILRRLLRERHTNWANAAAALTAAVFALHPVHVESVAWITELKNTLSGVFYLSAMAVYLTFDRTRQWKWYALATACFVLGLLTKTVTATLPAALLVVFWWQRGRVSIRRDITPLVPWFVLGAAAGLFTAWVEHDLIGAKGEEFGLTAVQRFLLTGRVAWFYLYKLVWPTELIFIYPRWRIDPTVGWQWLFPAALLGTFIVLTIVARRRRAPLAALLFFLGTLFPVLGFFNVYPFLFSYVADHFQYLASLGVIALACSAIAAALSRIRSHAARVAVAAMLPAVLGALSFRQSGMYTDRQTLYRTTLQRNPDCWMAHNNLGVEYKKLGQLDEALACYRRALELRPDYPEAFNNTGLALAANGDLRGAASAYRHALKLRPRDPHVLSNLGTLLSQMGLHADAIAQHQAALRLDGSTAQLYGNFGVSLQAAGRLADAVAQYRKSLELIPDQPGLHTQIAICEAASLTPPKAIEAYGAIIRDHPDNVQAHFARGVLLAQSGRTDAAIDDYRRAIEIQSDHFEALNNLASMHARAGHHAQAISHFEQAVRLRPDSVEVRMNLAVAYAAIGRQEDAQTSAGIALKQAQADGRRDLVQKIQNWIDSSRPHPDRAPQNTTP